MERPAYHVIFIGRPIVPEPFSVVQSHGAPVDPAVRSEIRARTGSEAATSAILRSIERFGDDPTILRYEVSPASTTRFGGPLSTVAWTVRAVRT